MNRNLQRCPAQAGFLLIEAMVALMVVSLGALALLSFNTTLLRDSGLSKTRAEALQIAQNRVDEIRHGLVMGGCDPAAPPSVGTTTVSGVNANYVANGTAAVNAAGTSGPWVALSVCVSWDGAACSAGTALDKRIILNSRLNCSGVGTSGDLSGSGLPGTPGMAGFLKTPTGRAVVGGQETTGTQVGSDDPFGNKIIETATGDRVLVGADGEALLTIKKLACEDTAPPFSTLEGRLYVETDGQNNPLVTGSNLFALSSDASYCQTSTPAQFLSQYVNGNGTRYYYVNYLCYVGAEWWGNVGVVRTDNANSSNRVCTGNTFSSAIAGNIYSKDEKLGSTRGYRGYREINASTFETVGIGETDDLYTNSAGSQCKNGNRWVYKNRAQYLKNHHFVLTKINGQANDASCGTALSNLQSSSLNPPFNTGSSDANTLNPNPASGAAVTVTANRNPGKFYCMTDLDYGTDCGGGSVTPPPARSTLIRGTIDRGAGGDRGAIGAIEAPGATCEATDLDADGNNQYIYSCDVNWEGWTGETWAETVTFTSTDKFCPATLAVTISPSGSQGLAAVTLSNASGNKSLNFEQVPPAVTEIVANFSIRKSTASCP